ncbi:hypothetical protein JTE90_025930 [Oedothorax gibbosus]|uniref:ZP domain-containing protein n=1 Tax=Oedothorax gibbosus TaxID=931172 RepID=A0AAV6UC06_9ARAC|nr:hypothetical protein JTE90_025930 [Oedothorax gibbosus]
MSNFLFIRKQDGFLEVGSCQDLLNLETRQRGMSLKEFLYLISCILMCVIQVVVCDEGAGWRSGPPDGLPELIKLSVECGKEEMTVYLEFSAPYDGTVYSKSNGHSPRCIHVPPHSHITQTTFSVSYDACGTRSDPHGKFYENTVVVQYDDVVIEAWDEAKRIRCEWHDGYEKSAYKMPIAISDLDVVEMNFQGDDVDCWLEVQDGKGPWSAKVEGLVPLGSPLTLVVAIQDSEGHFDMRVKSCIAHDGHKHPIHLTDEDGCVLRPKMMTPFQKTTDTKGTASVIAYSHFYAFKFPETVEVTIQCTVEICRHGCPGTCLQGRDSSQTSHGGIEYQQPPPLIKEGDDIPTYKDSFPFSTVVTSRPQDQQNFSSVLNVSSNTIHNTIVNNSKDDTKDPLEASPNTHHDFYLDRYPYDLFNDGADLMAQDRQDDKVEYGDQFGKASDGVYYSPGIYKDRNEHGKNFPSDQNIHSVSNKTVLSTTTEPTSTIKSEPLPPTEAYLMTTVPNLNESTTLTVQMGMHTSTLEPDTTEIVADLSSEEVSSTTEDIINTTIVNGNITTKEDTQSRNVNPTTENYIRIVTVSTQPTTATNEIFVEPADYNEALAEEHKDSDYDYDMDRKHSEDKVIYQDYDFQKDYIDDHKTKDPADDDYKARARKPSDTFEARQNYHYPYHKPHGPLALAPPITLYNGVPLQYYYSTNNNPVRDSNFMDRNGHPYLSRYPYHNKDYTKLSSTYVKSKLRRPGRRGRRDIGENEQLGLKQTLKVIATTDFDYFSNDVKARNGGVKEQIADVCMAPSSLAAGLGLLLLANVCVLCVAVFLGHHYYVHRKTKGKAVELLDTEVSQS